MYLHITAKSVENYTQTSTIDAVDLSSLIIHIYIILWLLHYELLTILKQLTMKIKRQKANFTIFPSYVRLEFII